MLKLKELRLSGIGRFVEEQIIDFTDLGNLVQIDGQNNNTGGSSGSGKTTVFNALEFLLGLNDLPNSVLQSRLTKESLNVTGVFDEDGKPLKIQRGKKLSVERDGNLVTGSSKLSEEEIDKILQMPRHLFRAMLHKRQKEGGFFLQFTPKEIHEFLTDCLGLTDLRKKAELVDKKVKELTEKINSLLIQLENSKAGRTATQDAILALGLAPVKEINQEAIVDLKQKYEAALASLAPVKAIHTLEVQNLEFSRPQLRSTVTDSSTLNALELELKQALDEKTQLLNKINALTLSEQNRISQVKTSISDLKLKLSSLDYNIRTAENVKSEASKTALEIKKIRESICPTCEQGWLTDTAKTKELQLLDKIKKFKEIIALGLKSQEESVQINDQIALLVPQLKETPIPEFPELAIFENNISELRNKISDEKYRREQFAMAQNHLNKVSFEDFALRQKQLSAKQAAELEQVNGQVDIARRVFETAAHKFRAYEDARIRYETSLVKLKEQEDSLNQKMAQLNQNLTALQEEFVLAEEAKKAIKSYTSCSFDDALESIGDSASVIIRSIPNMANATIQLEGIKETKEGKLKEEVNAVISMDGEVGIPIKSLSGGERSAVDLAVDLAVIDLIESKTGKGIDLFILDEPFTGLDTVSIEMALEVLKNSNLNKKLIIVDHNPEVKQMVQDRLIVVRDGSSSKIIKQ